MQNPSLVGQVLDGRYKIVRLLGEGGMGEVYAAEHVHIDKKLAIKLLRPEIVSNDEAVKRFRQEARSSSSIGTATSSRSTTSASSPTAASTCAWSCSTALPSTT